MKENWKVVKTSPGHEISDKGRVRSLARRVPYGPGGATRSVPAKLLSPFWVSNDRNKQGHLAIDLSDGRHQIHHLVLEHFVGPRPTGLLGLHNDGDASNNAVMNLRWDTYSANAFDAVSHGTHHQSRKTRCPYDHPLDGVSSRGGRYCRTCNNERNREAKAKRRGTIQCQMPGCENIKTPGQANRYCESCRLKQVEVRKIKAKECARQRRTKQ